MLNHEGPASLVKLFSTHSSFPCLFHSFRPYIWNTLGRARHVIHLGALSVPSRIGGERIIPNIHNTDSLGRVCFVHVRGYFQAIAPSG